MLHFEIRPECFFLLLMVAALPSTLTAAACPWIAMVALTAPASPPPAVQSITLHLENAAVPEIVKALRSRFCTAVSFVPAVPPGTATVEAAGATVPEVLSQIARSNPAYRSETIASREVLYPATPEFQVIVDHVDVKSKPRLDAAGLYLGLLRKEEPAFSQLWPPFMIGNPRHPVYSDVVTLRVRGRVIEHLVDLLGQNERVYFEIIEARSGVPAVFFTQLRCTAGPP
jgi:hypothetical protein